MLRVDQIKKYFPTAHGLVKAVDGVSLEIKENQIVGLVGESGSGKSTLGKMLIGLHDKTQGEVHWNDQLMPSRFLRKNFLEFSHDIQMIFQDPYSALNPRMQIWQLLEEPCLLSKNDDYLCLSKKQRLVYLQSWLEKVGLRTDFYDRYPHEFSGGQLQRIGIARALIQKPKLLICDEPISALDVSVQAQIVNLLKSLQAELGMSMLFIAHDLAMVNYLCDEVAVMYLGKIIEQGKTEEIFSQPQHPYTQLLLASNPVIGARLKFADNITFQGEIPSAIKREQACSFVSRCWKNTKHCQQAIPDLIQFGERKIACFNI